MAMRGLAQVFCRGFVELVPEISSPGTVVASYEVCEKCRAWVPFGPADMSLELSKLFLYLPASLVVGLTSPETWDPAQHLSLR